MKGILREVLKEITPEDNTDIAKFVKILEKEVDAEIVLGGSFAKKTHIGNDYDCDIFTRFDLNKKNISKLLLTALKKISKKLKFEIEVIHGSRDYYNFEYKNINFEIVPVYKIAKASDAENIMDMSPFHVDWIKKNIGKKNEDIRLIKKLFKANHIYGAESYVKGFSGHVLDIMVINYGGFKKTLEKITKWPKTTEKRFKKVIIDTEKYYKGKDIMFYMNKSKTISPLIVVDPIIPERNAAAALGDDCYDKAIDVAKRFLKKPSKQMFETTLISDNFSKLKNVFVVEFKPLKNKSDVAGAKVMKAFEYLVAKFNKSGFELIDSNWNLNEEKMFFSVKEKTIPKKYLQKGPTLKMDSAIASFMKAHKGKKFIEKKGILYVELERKFTDFDKFLGNAIKDKYVQERTQIKGCSTL